MFETFNVPAMYIAMQGILSLFSTGCTTGIIVDSGYGVTQTAPIYESFSIPHAVSKVNIAGHDLTTFLGKLLKDRTFHAEYVDHNKYSGYHDITK
jgi:actin-related protein